MVLSSPFASSQCSGQSKIFGFCHGMNLVEVHCHRLFLQLSMYLASYTIFCPHRSSNKRLLSLLITDSQTESKAAIPDIVRVEAIVISKQALSDLWS